MKATLIFSEERITGEGLYRIEIKVYGVEKSARFPEGIKAKFVLVDLVTGQPRVLIDNHAPYGFHTHAGLPSQAKRRETLNVKDYQEAKEFFFKEVEKMTGEE